MISRLLDDQFTDAARISKSNTSNNIADSGYFETYNHYDIHKEMLQVL